MEKIDYCLITGATGGLGKAFCNEMAKKGYNLIITSTSQALLSDWKNELSSKYPNIIILSQECDLSSEESRNNFTNFIVENGANIIFLINNAGYITEGSVSCVTEKSLTTAIKVNCEGTTSLTKWFIDNCDKTKENHILTVASLAGFYAIPHMGVYSATKSYLISFMSALREEVKNQNIIVSTITPSGIYTTQEMKDAIKSQGFFGKATSCLPEEIASYGIKKALKGKNIIVPKAINRFTRFISIFAPYQFNAKVIGKRWRKSQNKRNIK